MAILSSQMLLCYTFHSLHRGIWEFLLPFLKVAHFYRASNFFKWSSVKVLTQNVAFAIWLMTGHCILMNKRNSLSEGCFLAFFSKAFENRSPPTTFYKFNEISRIPYRFTIRGHPTQLHSMPFKRWAVHKDSWTSYWQAIEFTDRHIALQVLQQWDTISLLHSVFLFRYP